MRKNNVFFFQTALILILFVCPLERRSEAFDSTFRRYLAGHDLLRTLRFHFPHAAGDRLLSNDCQKITPTNRDTFGEIQPVSFRPSAKTVTSVYVDWLTVCVSRYIENDFIGNFFIDREYSYRPLTLEFVRAHARFFGRGFETYLINHEKDFVAQRNDPRTLLWSKLPADVQNEILETRIKVLLSGRATKAVTGRLLTEIKTVLGDDPGAATIVDVLKRSSFVIITQEEFLSY